MAILSVELDPVAETRIESPISAVTRTSERKPPKQTGKEFLFIDHLD